MKVDDGNIFYLKRDWEKIVSKKKKLFFAFYIFIIFNNNLEVNFLRIFKRLNHLAIRFGVLAFHVCSTFSAKSDQTEMVT